MVFMIWDDASDRLLDDGWGQPLTFQVSAAAEEFIRRTGRGDLEVRLVEQPPTSPATPLPPSAPRH